MTKIHPTAIIDSRAELASGVEVGPWCIVEEGVSIASGTRLESCVRIHTGTHIGEGNFFGHGCAIGGDPQTVGFDSKLRSGVLIGDGNIFREGVIIHRSMKEGENTTIGNQNYLMGNTHLGHDTIMEDEVIFVHGSVAGGHSHVESKAFIGGLSAIHQFVRVGKYSMTAGCAKVVKDVPPFSTIDGNPATVIGINSIGLKRGGFDAAARKDIKNAYKTIYHSGLNISEAIKELQKSHELSEEAKAIVAFFENSERGVTRHR